MSSTTSRSRPPVANPNGLYSGQSCVVYGETSAPGTVELSMLNGTNGFRVSGIGAFDRSGFAVSRAGDVTSDGFDDLLIGAYGAAPNSSYSHGYVIYGPGRADSLRME